MNITQRRSFLAASALLILLSGCNLAKPRPPTPGPAPQSTVTPMPSPLPTSTTTPSPTPTPVQVILTPAAGPPLAGRIEDAPQDVSSPGSLTVMYDPQPLLWSNAWCAKDEKILANNLASIEWRFTLDGQSIPLEQFSPTSYTEKETGQACLRYALLLQTWPPGRHTLTKTLVLKQPLNDGKSGFPPGEQTRTETVFVADPSVPPPADPQVWLTLFEERFDPPALTWQIGDLKDEWFSGRGQIEDGKYILDMQEVHQNTVFRHPPAIKVLSGPFQVSVTAQRLDGAADDGACYGLYYHYNYTSGDFYQWTVCDDQHFSLEIYNEGAWDMPVPWTEEQAISPGMPNRLTARIEGSRMTFIINDKTVASLDDQRLYGGYTGILAQAKKDAPARFAFSDLTFQVP